MKLLSLKESIAQIRAENTSGRELEGVVMNPKHDSNFGMQESVRAQRFAEIYQPFEPTDLANDWEPPPEMCAMMEDHFGDLWRSGRLVLALHPYFKRITIFERWAERDGKPDALWPVMIIHRRARPGYLPEDLQLSDKRHEDCRGLMGDFDVPIPADLEFIKLFDSVENTPDQIVQLLRRWELKTRAEKERVEQDYLKDIFSYYGFWLMSIANQDAGSAQRPYSVANVKRGHDQRLQSKNYNVVEHAKWFELQRTKMGLGGGAGFEDPLVAREQARADRANRREEYAGMDLSIPEETWTKVIEKVEAQKVTVEVQKEAAQP